MTFKRHMFFSGTGTYLLTTGLTAIVLAASVAGYKTWFPDMAFPAAFILIMSLVLGTFVGTFFAMSAWLKRTPVPCDKCGAASYRRRGEEYYEYPCSRCGRVMLGTQWKDTLGD